MGLRLVHHVCQAAADRDVGDGLPGDEVLQVQRLRLQPARVIHPHHRPLPQLIVMCMFEHFNPTALFRATYKRKSSV